MVSWIEVKDDGIAFGSGSCVGVKFKTTWTNINIVLRSRSAGDKQSGDKEVSDAHYECGKRRTNLQQE